jgi:hypothetical protein
VDEPERRFKFRELAFAARYRVVGSLAGSACLASDFCQGQILLEVKPKQRALPFREEWRVGIQQEGGFRCAEGGIVWVGGAGG